MSGNILIVDDDESTRMTVAALLEDAGFSVQEAGSVAEATSALGPSVDIVILDYHLSDGLGSSLVPIIRERAPRARVIVSSGSAHGLTFGDVSFVKGRPFAELEALVHALLRR